MYLIALTNLDQSSKVGFCTLVVRNDTTVSKSGRIRFAKYNNFAVS
jgi:hypothetical protein